MKWVLIKDDDRDVLINANHISHIQLIEEKSFSKKPAITFAINTYSGTDIFEVTGEDYEILSKAFEMLMLMLASDSTKVIILNDLIEAVRKQIKKNE